jgi:hypothetical protein
MLQTRLDRGGWRSFCEALIHVCLYNIFILQIVNQLSIYVRSSQLALFQGVDHMQEIVILGSQSIQFKKQKVRVSLSNPLSCKRNFELRENNPLAGSG